MNTLYGKLSATLLTLLFMTSFLYFILSFWIAENYIKEVSVPLNRYVYSALNKQYNMDIFQKLVASPTLRISTSILLTSLSLSGVVGLIIFKQLTVRLQKLRSALEQFESTGFTDPMLLEPSNISQNDEIDDLRATFVRMSKSITRDLEHCRDSDNLRRQLVANISHDLRTPLASLTGFLETLLLKDDKLPASERRRYLEIAHKHGRSLSTRVSRLFELASLDAREIEPQFESFPVSELLSDVAQKFELDASSSNINIHTRINQELPFVYADVGLIERVLDNLIDNALQHTPKEGAITLSTYAKNSMIMVEVEDTGQGIPSNEIPFIFDRFYQAHTQDHATDGTGLGLGLAISKSIIELHGSQLEVFSQVGMGTRFRFGLRPT